MVRPDGTLTAWCWSPTEPENRRETIILVDGKEVARGRFDQPRADLVQAGIGDGAYGLDLSLPPHVVIPGQTAQVTLIDAVTAQQIGSTTVAFAPPPRKLAGNLDRVTKDGWISGWCWYPDAPDTRVELVILVDDEAAGTTRAAELRPDLRDAGIGDGAHGFSLALPWSALADKGLIRVSVHDAGTREMLGDPIIIRAGRVAAIDDRLRELERQIRQLHSLQEDIEARLQHADADVAARDLFATVARFFQSLADGQPEASPAGQLEQALEDVTSRLAPLALAIPAAPRATICVDGTASVDVLYRCLAALSQAGLDRQADIVLLDDGGHGGRTALLPTVVHNLRYLRAPAGTTLGALRNQAAASAQGETIAFIAPQARPTAVWLDEILRTFADCPEAALVTGRTVRDDGLLQHTGIVLGDDGLLRDPGHLAEADDAAYDFLAAVHGAGNVAFAVRRGALLQAGGFDGGFASLAHASFDLCCSLRGAGHAVYYQPLAVARWTDESVHDPAPVPDLGLPEEDARRLRRSCARLAAAPPAPAALPVGFIGHVLVIDTQLPQPDHDAGSLATLEQMLLLRRLGYRVSFTATDGQEAPEQAAALRRCGVEALVPPRYPSITRFLEQNGSALDIVHIYRYQNALLLLDRVRELAPQARVVFAPADLHFLREGREAELEGRDAAAVAETRTHELDCIRDSDVTIVTSDYELDLLRQEIGASAPLRLLRWIAHPRAAVPGFAGRRDLCFVGSFQHYPNVDGVVWFVTEVMPLLREELPELRLRIAGADAPAAVRELASPAVEILGWVADLEALFDAALLSVAPLRYGAGFKGKVATSLAHGVPVIGTAIAFEGTGLQSGEGIVQADDAAGFAAAIVRLNRNSAAWQALSELALQRCRDLYSPDAATAVWRDLASTPGTRAG